MYCAQSPTNLSFSIRNLFEVQVGHVGAYNQRLIRRFFDVCSAYKLYPMQPQVRNAASASSTPGSSPPGAAGTLPPSLLMQQQQPASNLSAFAKSAFQREAARPGQRPGGLAQPPSGLSAQVGQRISLAGNDLARSKSGTAAAIALCSVWGYSRQSVSQLFSWPHQLIQLLPPSMTSV